MVIEQLVGAMATDAKMRFQTLTVGPVSCTCCIVACAETGEAAIVDPGGDADEILAKVASMAVTVKLVLHTHAHFDHILGTGEVVAATRAEVLLHASDRDLYQNLPRQGRLRFSCRPPASGSALAGRWRDAGHR